MSKEGLSSWAKYLRHPLVLIGFVIMLLFGLVETLLKSDILLFTDENTQQVIQNILWYAFLLGAIVTLLGFLLALKQRIPDDSVKNSVTQKTTGAQSPAIVSQGKVNISYNNLPSDESDREDKA